MAEYSKLANFIRGCSKKLSRSLAMVFAYWYVRIYLVIILIINILVWVVARFIASTIDLPKIALHYNVDFGIDLYGNTAKIYVIPLLGLVIFFINLIIITILNRYNQKEVRFIFHLLLLGSIITNIILLAAIISVYVVNFR